jgi:hypothetical protein
MKVNYIFFYAFVASSLVKRQSTAQTSYHNIAPSSSTIVQDEHAAAEAQQGTTGQTTEVEEEDEAHETEENVPLYPDPFDVKCILQTKCNKCCQKANRKCRANCRIRKKSCKEACNGNKTCDEGCVDTARNCRKTDCHPKYEACRQDC